MSLPGNLKWSWCNNNRSKYTINAMCISHSETAPHAPPLLWKNYLPWEGSLVPEWLGLADLNESILRKAVL